MAFLPAGLLLFAALRVAPVMTALAGIPTSALVLTQVSASFMGIVNLDPAPVMMGNPPLLVISLFALQFGIFVSVYVILRVKESGHVGS